MLHNTTIKISKKKRSCGRATSKGYFPRLVSHLLVITLIVYKPVGFLIIDRKIFLKSPIFTYQQQFLKKLKIDNNIKILL